MALLTRARCALALVALASPAALAQTGNDTLDALLDANTFALTVDPDAGLDGPGGALIVERASGVSFTAIGEAHLNVETPDFALALARDLHPAGYGVYAIETGPIAAETLAELAASGGPEAIGAWYRSAPFSAAFFDHLPEAEMLTATLALGYEAWGLDQEFIGAGRYLLRSLVELAPNDDARRLAEAEFARAMAGMAHFAETGDQSRGFLPSTTAAQFDELRAAFAGVHEAERIVDELAASANVYQLFGQRKNYESNRDRIALMKEHLAANLRAAPEARVLLRFGSMHMGRGYSPLNQLDLGAFVGEVGALRGDGSLHLEVTALEMERSDGTTFDARASNEAMAAIEAKMDELGADWVVVDLTALRPLFHRERNREGFEKLNALVWRFDLLVVTRGFTRAARFEGLPGVPGS